MNPTKVVELKMGSYYLVTYSEVDREDYASACLIVQPLRPVDTYLEARYWGYCGREYRMEHPQEWLDEFHPQEISKIQAVMFVSLYQLQGPPL